jgi:MFS family permease
VDAKRPDGSAEVTTEAVSRAHALGLHGTLLVSGASVMIVEILGTRLLGPFFGLGTPVWAALITVTLAALALGYGLGGALADRRPSPALFHGLVVLAGVATALCRPLAGPVMERFEPLGLRAGALLSAVVIFGPSLFLLGTLTPFAVRLHPGRTSRTGGTVGRLYAVSTIGSVAGALLVGFVLVPAMPVSRIFQTTAGTLVLVGLLGLVLRRVKLGSAAAAGALALVVLAPGPEPEDPFGITVVRDEQTFYNRIQTIDAFHERFLFLDGLVHTHLSTTIPDDPVQCEYVRLVELLADVRPEAKRFLAIGCGAAGCCGSSRSRGAPSTSWTSTPPSSARRGRTSSPT